MVPQRQQDPGRHQPAARAAEARGLNGTVRWDGRTLTARMRFGRGETVIPARQIASITLHPVALHLDVTTTDGRALKVTYWFGRTAQFRAFRDAVASTVAAMG